MIVCLCRGVPESAIRAVIARGATTVSDIRRACGAGGDCGACCPLLAELVGQDRRPACSGAASQGVR
jgi:bacterioferritin-associated ferredoxin